MSHELIRTWLKLPAGDWPPDHYTLLGLSVGEPDTERIERHVQLRMEWVRRYQLAHPDLVTEAMNRLAQAFDCLRDAESKQDYDVRLKRGEAVPPKGPASKPALNPPPATLKGPASKPVVNPPPVSAKGSPSKPVLTPASAKGPASRPVLAAAATTVASDRATLEVPPEAVPDKVGADEAATAPPPPVEEPVDPALEAARSWPARRGLGTKRAIYTRISRTRRLIRAWVQAGKYLGDPRFQVTQKPEAIDLVRQLTIIRQQLQDFPPLLGQAGQPGYLVIALARQPEIVKTFLALSPAQRRGYVRDWQAGLTFLAAYRLFLREELTAMRRRGRVGRLLLGVKSLVVEHPTIWLLLLALLTANLAWPPLWEKRVVQGIVLAGALVLFFILRDSAPRRRPALHRIRRETGGD
ncbi:MAG: hypothetical protein JNM56_35805 [Planctomycetia bacterium]|nr:hypothetical protein [Planctomycetia bacterium]